MYEERNFERISPVLFTFSGGQWHEQGGVHQVRTPFSLNRISNVKSYESTLFFNKLYLNHQHRFLMIAMVIEYCNKIIKRPLYIIQCISVISVYVCDSKCYTYCIILRNNFLFLDPSLFLVKFRLCHWWSSFKKTLVLKNYIAES